MALTTTTPVLQAWLAGTGRPAERLGAFRLYAAGSAGSLLGLLAYPTIIERSLDLVDQERWWSAGYLVYAVLIVVGAIGVFRRPASFDRYVPAPVTTFVPELVTVRARLGWVALAAIPAALVVGTTAHLSTDVAAVPLLWIGPLAIYLGTFVLAFGGRRPVGLRLADRLLPLLALAAIVTMFDGGDLPIGIVFAAQLGALAVVGLVCHGRLVLARPGPGGLTGFDLAIASGGAIGGILAGLVGPLILPVAVEGAVALRPRPGGPRSPDPRAVTRGDGSFATRLHPAAPGTVRQAGAVPGLVRHRGGRGPRDRARSSTRGSRSASSPAACSSGRPLPSPVGRWPSRPSPPASSSCPWRPSRPTLRSVRTFYGIHRVAADPTGRHALFGGTTVQGLQQYLPVDLRDRPIGYYHLAGPVADVVAAVRERTPSVRAAVVGLGAGAIAAYGRQGDELTFYEIDPAVVAIARDPGLFTYLADTRARVTVVIGDGRLGLAAGPAGSDDLVVVDAFASDAIPVHLLTREAIAIDMARLRPGGLIAFNVSNRYLDLEPILAAAARDLGLSGMGRVDDPPPDRAGDADPSHWVVLAADRAALTDLAARPGWRPLVAPAERAWTDRWSDLLGALIGF